MNALTRIFVAAHRVFGVFTAAAGALLAAMTIVSYLRGVRSFSGAVIYAVLGSALILVGVMLLRTPRPRPQRPTPAGRRTQRH